MVNQLGLLGEIAFDVSMMIPASRPNLNEAHAVLYQTSCDQHAATDFGVAVHRADVLGFFVHIKDISRLGLHLECELEGLDTRL